LCPSDEEQGEEVLRVCKKIFSAMGELEQRSISEISAESEVISQTEDSAQTALKTQPPQPMLNIYLRKTLVY
jgi:hypothetical protein